MSMPLTDLIDRVLALLADLDLAALALATGLFTALETTALIGLVVPGDLVVLLAGSTADTPARFAAVMAAATVGTYAGELCGYAIGRAAGPKLRTSRLGRLLGERRWARAEAYLAANGAPVLVPVRFVSVLHAIAPMVAGAVGMPVRRFAGWAGLGAVVWAGTYTTVGAAAGTAYREHGHLGLATSVAVIGVTALVLAARSRLRRRRARTAREPASGGPPEAAPAAPVRAAPFPVVPVRAAPLPVLPVRAAPFPVVPVKAPKPSGDRSRRGVGVRHGGSGAGARQGI